MMLDAADLEWSDPRIRALHSLLWHAYPTGDDVEDLVSSVSDWPRAFLHWSHSDGSDSMWKKVLDRAAAAGATRNLLAAAFEDPNKTGYRGSLHKIVDELSSVHPRTLDDHPALSLVVSPVNTIDAGVDVTAPDRTDFVSVVSHRCHESLVAIVPAVLSEPALGMQSVAEARKALRGLDVVIQQLIVAADSAADSAQFARLRQLATDLDTERDAAFGVLRKLREGRGGHTAAGLCDILAAHADSLTRRLGDADSLLT
ncbi:effector-associated domain EAD1-containing protein [Amycolatopsis sp. NBC_00438]|uniref:effector-associated domain EAD1-containing protein n=1 Tax=Amycolatopsis sp. NBC_00438 TaxID=2903558 RepID=UPI002E1E3F40